MSELSRSLVDAAAEAMYLAWHRSAPFEDQAEDVRADYFLASSPVVAAVLETLAAHYYERAAQRGEASGDGPQCDGDCGNDDCHMTSAVAAWQMAAATAQRAANEAREGR